MEAVLIAVGLHDLINKFDVNKVTPSEALKLSDEELATLGVSTIGDRIRLREKLKDINKVNVATPSPSASHMDAVALFRPNRLGSQNKQRRKRQATWTGSFFCFSDKESSRCPTPTEKSTLQKSGLGYKRIQLLLTDNAEEVRYKVCREYPKLVEGGGFELMRCLANCRRLDLLECNWDTLSLRACVGSQAKIYIRPIQRNLPIDDCGNFMTEDVSERCKNCSELINIRSLRDHLKLCHDSQLETTELENVTSASTPQGANMNNLAVEGDGSKQEHEGMQEVVHYFLEYLDQPVPVNIQAEGTSHFPQDGEVSEEGSNGVDLSGVALGSLDVEDDKDNTIHKPASVKEAVSECTSYCKSQNISEPITILKFYQSLIVTGRPLEITEEDLTTGLVGETNFILVDRSNLVKTALDEIKSLKDLRKCLEVQFYGESAVDYGGPRKEFFSLILQQLQKEFFEPVRPWSEEYETIGKIMALSVIQNGKLPKMLTEEILKEILESESPRRFIKDLGRGLDNLGLLQLAKELPTMIHLFTTTEPVPLTLKMLTNLLTPHFSPEGSNRRKLESAVYSTFIKYMREAASGRRGATNLQSILRFATGTDEEPALGFGIQPSIWFSEAKSFMPTANTCINRMNITIPQGLQEMPSNEELFNFFDLAFSNSYFGLE